MFRNIIRETALTNQKANAFFGERVSGDTYNGDTTLVSTLRAIIYPRMGDSDSLRVTITNTTADKSSTRGRSVSDICGGIFGYTRDLSEASGHFVVHSLNGTEEETAHVIKAIDKGFMDAFPGYIQVEKIAEFYKSFAVRCFINTERKITLMIIDRMDVRKLHYIQAAILPSMPWYYDPANGVLPEELEILKAFKEKESKPYTDAIEVIATKYDFRTPWLRSVLAEYESIAEREELRALESEIQRCRRYIDETKASLGDRLRELDQLNARHYGLSWCIGEANNSEILDYLLCDKNIFVDAVDGGHLYFSASGYLTHFDDDMAESVINRGNSYLYNNDSGYTYEQMKKFYTALFLDKTLKIRFCAAYEMDIGGRRVNAQTDYAFSQELADFMPNPHIDHYRCMGNYTRVIGDCFEERNYVGVIQQCAASCVSLNFGDGTVMSDFARKVLSLGYKDKRYITLPDGTNVTHGEAIAWLESQEESTNEQTAEEA